jgi:predicted dehydrogenase
MAGMVMMAGAIEIKAAEQAAAAAKEAEAPKTGPPVRCGVIGCGVWGREVLKTLARLPNAPVPGICDTYEPFLRRAAEAAPKAEKFSDYRKLLEQKEVQAVLIATPTPLHREMAVAALQSGKHVYCEAPLATTVEDVTAIAKAAKTAGKQIFQCGLLLRSSPIHKHVVEFVRTGALGKNALARAQWHKKQSWRRASPNPEREQALNWHLNQATSIGLIGELGIHPLDTASWFFKHLPVAVTGFGSIMMWNDGRDVADTVQAVVEFPGNLRMVYDATLANSFDSNYEIYHGTDSAIVIRENRAWLIKETDAPLLGWEVYARKEEFAPGKESGIALVANATRLLAQGKEPAEAAADSETPLYYALEELVENINENKSPSSGYLAGLEATVTAIKANEAIAKNQKVIFQKEWFDLA